MAHPEFQHTAPVSRRSASSSLGVVQNIGSAQGETGGLSSVGGNNNTSKGGSVSNGGASFQQAPVAPSAQLKDASTGSNKKTLLSSNNPLLAQDQVGINKLGEQVAQTSSAPESSVSTGYHTDMPRAQTTVTLPDKLAPSVRTVSAEIGADVTISLKGIETSRTFGSVDDLERIANDAGVVKAPGRGSTAATRQNGADGPPRGKGDPTPQERDTERAQQVSPDFPEDQ